MELVFDKKEHLYTLDGRLITGVTTILSVIAKPALIQWSANEAVNYVKEHVGTEEDMGPSLWTKRIMWQEWDKLLEEARFAHRRKKDNAADIGTRAHKWIEQYIKSPDLVPEKDLSIMTDNFVKWAEESKVKFLESEVMVYDSDLFYAGTLDFVAEIGGKKFIGDIKTGSGIYPEHFYQVAAYRNAWEKMGREKLDGAVIVNITKKGELKVEYSYFYQEDFEAFCGALKIYRRQQKVTN